LCTGVYLLLAGPVNMTVAASTTSPPSQNSNTEKDKSAASGKDNKIYRSVDEHGNLVFSDQASDNSEAVNVKAPMTYDSRESLDALNRINRLRDSASSGPTDPEILAPYDQLQVTSPQPDESIRENSGSLSITGRISPLLHPEHQVQIVLDGVVVSDGLAATLGNIDRGTHQVHLRVVDSTTGETFQDGPTVTFHLMRYSMLHPGSK